VFGSGFRLLFVQYSKQKETESIFSLFSVKNSILTFRRSVII